MRILYSFLRKMVPKLMQKTRAGKHLFISLLNMVDCWLHLFTLKNSILTSSFFTGSTNVASFLIKRGAEINARNNLEETPLFKAVEHCNYLSMKVKTQNNSLNESHLHHLIQPAEDFNFVEL